MGGFDLPKRNGTNLKLIVKFKQRKRRKRRKRRKKTTRRARNREYSSQVGSVYYRFTSHLLEYDRVVLVLK
jgi:hypothetical protein